MNTVRVFFLKLCHSETLTIFIYVLIRLGNLKIFISDPILIALIGHVVHHHRCICAKDDFYASLLLEVMALGRSEDFRWRQKLKSLCKSTAASGVRNLKSDAQRLTNRFQISHFKIKYLKCCNIIINRTVWCLRK